MLLLKVAVIVCLIGTVVGTCCMDYWTAYNGKCYRYYDLLKSWYDAEYYCINMGAHLVGINDRAENDFVNFLTSGPQNDNQPGHPVWIGFNDIYEEGEWSHIDESFYGFHNWAHGEPNDQNDEDCAETNYFQQRGVWNDENCYVRRCFVCESYD
ncbi:C-type lectin domain family 17, member A-like [Amphiura filiformis]|uniref:C-type lectin domain family 17, member A-like n=1 Tax=Amphiura filiformis TaxID=82378 RepID=UPI003B21F04E